MDTLHKCFAEAWQRARPLFPDGGTIDYALRLQNIEAFLFEKVHDKVALLSALHESGVLTDHGPNHIRTVLRRAGDLCCAIDANLTGYENYLLILAIHFHDVGNMLGREKHEEKIVDVFHLLAGQIGADNIEKRILRSIAKTHGGYNEVDGSKDTINELNVATQVYGAPVRPQLLAAILRFADELAEERQRANALYLNLIAPEADGKFHQTPDLPPEGEAYHKIATLICPPEIEKDGQALKIVYELLLADLRKTFRKSGNDVYLIDEILARITKTYEEKEYFSQFTRRYRCKPIEQMTAEIHLLEDGNAFTPIETYSYIFRDTGYPSAGGDPSELLARYESAHRSINGASLKDAFQEP
jgi:hypothetical protein